MHCPYIHLHVWKPSSLLLGPCVPSHPLSGYYCDTLFKELRFASNWDPRYLPHLDLTDGTQRYSPLTHIRRLSQLPNLSTEFVDALTAAATWLVQPSSHADTSSLLPWQLRWSCESASLHHPYSWFSTSPELLKNTSDFTYAELVTILEQPIYGLWSLQRCIPMKPPSLPRGLSYRGGLGDVLSQWLTVGVLARSTHAVRVAPISLQAPFPFGWHTATGTSSPGPLH